MSEKSSNFVPDFQLSQILRHPKIKTMTNEIILYQPDESVQLEVRVQDESV